MGSDHKALLYYCEVRWLSRAKVLQRIFELKEEIGIFLQNNKHPEYKVFSDKDFITKLAYSTDIFEQLNYLNLWLQGSNMNIFFQKDKITSFIKKLELWTKSCQDDNFDMFPNLTNICSIEKIKEHKAIFIGHLI